ncbi:MAG: DUF4194 domain-containing protein [Pseudomonadota bacterium]|nr:DUF4194 domain-containing protein [Pseudomonadota bacterium]
MSDFFDQRARQISLDAFKNIASDAGPSSAEGEFDSNLERLSVSDQPAPPPRATLPTVKTAVQELLRIGVVEAEARPRIYDTLRRHPQEVAQALEPLDLICRLDEVRGLAWLWVGQGYAGDTSAEAAMQDAVAASGDDDAPPADAPVPGDGWSHPLVRRQRLTLEQSLLLALLRQHYLAHEQQAGVGGGVARVDLVQLGAELATHLGDSGSEAKDDKRLRQLLATLKDHGVVGEVDGSGYVPIRPLIAHVANPATLLALLRQYQALAATTAPRQDGEEAA